jgi:hypothetical protein
MLVLMMSNDQQHDVMLGPGVDAWCLEAGGMAMAGLCTTAVITSAPLPVPAPPQRCQE